MVERPQTGERQATVGNGISGAQGGHWLAPSQSQEPPPPRKASEIYLAMATRSVLVWVVNSMMGANRKYWLKLCKLWKWLTEQGRLVIFNLPNIFASTEKVFFVGSLLCPLSNKHCINTDQVSTENSQMGAEKGFCDCNNFLTHTHFHLHCHIEFNHSTESNCRIFPTK